MPVKHTFVSAKADGGDATKVRPSNWNDDHTITSFELPSVLSPTSLTANQDDYNPTNLATAAVLRLEGDADRIITGLAGGSDGRLVFVHNVGTRRVILSNESASSSAANRFAFAHDLVLWPDDSCVLQYDVTSSRWRLAAGQLSDWDYDIIDFSDDFLTTGTETGEIGQLGWNSTASGTAANSAQNATFCHAGVIRLGSGSTSGNNSRIHLGSAVTNTIIMASQLEYFGWIVSVPTITSVIVRLGVGTDPSNSAFGTAGIWFEFDPAGNANWRVYTRSASASTGPTNTGVVVGSANWYLLEALKVGSTWEFYINQALVATHSTNLPTVAVTPGALVQTATTAARQLDIDWFRIRSLALGQRWT